MKRNKLKELINTEEKWFRVDVPFDLHSNILSYIGAKYYRSLQLLKIFKIVSITLSLLFVVTFVVMFQFILPRGRVVYVYPHSGTEKEVYIITRLHKQEKKIPLKLDEEKGLWKAVLHTKNLKNIENFELLVEEFPSEEIIEE